MHSSKVENTLIEYFKNRTNNINCYNVATVLLFLLPIFSITFRHWLSYLFGMLAILSLVHLFKLKSKDLPLQKDEKVILWAFLIFFLVFILTSIVNGWGELQTRYSGVEIRFLLFIPVYLLVRQIPDATKWFLWGVVCALCVTFFDSVFTMWFDNEDRYFAVYGPLFTGPVVVLMMVLLIPFIEKIGDIKVKAFVICVVVASVSTVTLTGARSALFALPILMMIAFLNLNGVRRLVALCTVIVASVVVYNSVDRVSDRINLFQHEVKKYMKIKNPAKVKRLSSVGLRLEMWRTTPIYFMDNPVFGVGRGNYVSATKKHVKKRKVNRRVLKHAHPHNAYSEMLISKGTLGVLSFLGITLLPLILLLKDYGRYKKTAVYGVLTISFYYVVSISDASTFIKGNFVSLYIVLMAIFYSQFIRDKYKVTD